MDQSNHSKNKHQDSEEDQDQSKSERRRIGRCRSGHCPTDRGHAKSKNYKEDAKTNHHPIFVHAQCPFCPQPLQTEGQVLSGTNWAIALVLHQIIRQQVGFQREGVRSLRIALFQCRACPINVVANLNEHLLLIWIRGAGGKLFEIGLSRGQ